MTDSSGDAPGFDPQAFDAAKAESLGQLLLKAARLFNERAVGRLRRHGGFSRIRLSHLALFPHLSLSGIRLTELARRLEVSKQAAGQLVDELIDMGVLAREPDPDDGRAKLIVFTERGKLGLMTGLSVLVEVEREIAERTGERLIEELRASLIELLSALDCPP